VNAARQLFRVHEAALVSPSLYSREQQLPKEQREAEEAEQSRAKRQRRGMRM